MSADQMKQLAIQGVQRHDGPVPPEDILLTLARTTMQRRVGFQPPHTEITGTRIAVTHRACTEQAIRYLALILPQKDRKKLPYTWATSEWFTALYRTGQRIHNAYVMGVIEWGTAHDHMRPYIRPLLDDRAVWAMGQCDLSPHEWAWESSFVSMEDQLEMQREHEQDIMDMLEIVPLRDLMDSLPVNRFIWGERFTLRVLDLIEETYPNAQFYEAAAPYSLLYTMAFHCPLACEEKLMTMPDFIVNTILNHRDGDDLPFSHERIMATFDGLKQKIQHIITFRRKMVTTIENGE